MTTHKKALKLARTALGVQLDALLGKAGHLHNDDRRRYAENGIKAIDEALAQPEQEPTNCRHCGGDANTICAGQCKTNARQPELCKYGQEPKSCTSSPMDCQCAIDATLAQPEQEPVAYLYHDASNLEELLEAERKCLNMHSVLISIRRHEAYRNETPLYTTPPQPKEPEQEPVAVYQVYFDNAWHDKRADEMWMFTKDHGYQDNEVRVLFTAPPHRKPLTLEQLRKHWQVAKVLDMTDAEIDFADYVLITRDVEALHDIKE